LPGKTEITIVYFFLCPSLWRF